MDINFIYKTCIKTIIHFSKTVIYESSSFSLDSECEPKTVIQKLCSTYYTYFKFGKPSEGAERTFTA